MMARFQVTIRALLLGVALLSLGMAALRFASPTWTAIMTITWLGLLFASILGVFHASHQRFWKGVALFGWGFVLIDMTPWSSSTFQIRSALIGFFDQAYPHVHATPPMSVPGKGKGKLASTAPPQVLFGTQEHRAFQRCGVVIAGMLFAVIGGVISGAFWGRQDRRLPMSRLSSSDTRPATLSPATGENP